jgi:hypothetical protein
VRRTAALLALLALVLAVGGCNLGGQGQQATRQVAPLTLVRILPTPPGLRQRDPGRSANAAAVQAALAGRADAPSARNLVDSGLGTAAIRRWSGPRGASLLVVVSDWDDHNAATDVGGDAAELPLGRPGASAWTPTQVAGGRGSRVDAPGRRSRALSYAVDTTELFVRSQGPVPDDVVVRAMQRMIAALGAGEAPS